MAENYKHLYEQTKKMLIMYQDEIVPGFRKQIEELEKNQVKVLCKDCNHFHHDDDRLAQHCRLFGAMMGTDDFCSCGERKDNEV